MDRRRFLGALATAGTGGLAGCGSRGPESPTVGSTRTTTATRTATESPTETAVDTPADLPDWLPVPWEDLTRGAARDAIPAIMNPRFAADWSGLVVRYLDPRLGERRRIEPRLRADDPVVGITRDGAARAYPLRVLAWHEVVNDGWGEPLLVTYCPLCATAVTEIRRVDGEPARFGVSGLLYNRNLVLYDAPTDSLWSQVRATAIRGPKVGTRLELVTSTVTTWGEWRADHPDTDVLLPPPESSTVRGRRETRNYEVNPYDGYADGGDGVAPKTKVVGVAHDGAATAYPLGTVLEAGGVVNDEVGGLPVVVAATAGGSLTAFVRRVGGERVTVEAAGLDRMTAAGSTWDRTTGEAVDGPHEGSRLARANDRSTMYLFTWRDLYPETDVYGDAETATPSG